MGRKPVKKVRINDQATTDQWVKNIVPIILKQGFYKMTMDEVVKLAGVSKATFYKYYTSREELIDNIIHEKVQELYRFQSSLFDARLPYVERYLEATIIVSKVLSGISNTFLADLKKAYPDKFRTIEEFKMFVIKMLENYYTEGIQQGYLAPINPKVVVMTDQLFYGQLMDGEYLEKNGLTLKECLIQYTLMKNSGLIQREGADGDFMDKLLSRVEEMDENLEQIMV